MKGNGLCGLYKEEDRRTSHCGSGTFKAFFGEIIHGFHPEGLVVVCVCGGGGVGEGTCR